MTTLDPSPMVADDADELRERLAALFREHYAGLCGFAVRYVREPHIAEEVVQEVFLRIWEQCEATGGTVPSRAYLYAAARNQALTILRHERVVNRYVARQVFSGALEVAYPSADAAVELDDVTQAARRAIAALPERSRLVFQLSRDHGMTYAEIAVVLGISIKTVEGTMMRALKRLRAGLEGFGIVSLIAHMMPRLLI